MMASFRSVMVLSILVSATVARPSMAQVQPSGDATSSTPIVLNYRTNMEGGIAGHLPAIMAQQAVLLAIREQLQLDIADGIFRDRAKELSSPESYVLEVKASMEGTFSMHLLQQAAEASKSVDKANAIWTFEFPYEVGSKITRNRSRDQHIVYGFSSWLLTDEGRRKSDLSYSRDSWAVVDFARESRQ